jgi:hypothetical protein
MLRRAMIVASTFFFTPAAIWPCTCPTVATEPCQGLKTGYVVFLGTVTQIENPASADSNTGDAQVRHYHFRIDERFSGPDTNEIDVFSGGNDADCGYRFQKGEQYLVFPYAADDGRLFATICSNTRPASEAHALIPQLRAMRSGARVASVFGVLRRTERPYGPASGDPGGVPLAHVEVKLRSRFDLFDTTTDENGVYSLYGVFAGTYQLTAILPPELELSGQTLGTPLPSFELPSEACYEYNINALPTGSIRGSVLGPDGKPLHPASVELYRADHYDDSRPGWWEYQGERGYFEFDHVGAGDYILVFNRHNRLDPNSPFPRAFYPGTPDLGQAERIEVREGQQIEKADIHLEEGLPSRQIKVRIESPRRITLRNLVVTAKADHGENPIAYKLPDGLYQFTLLKDARYTISAHASVEAVRRPHRRRRSRHKNDPSGAGQECSPSDTVEATPVEVEGGDDGAEDITLAFARPECGP